MTKALVTPRQWTRDGFIISTDKSLISLPALNKALASDLVYWTSALPEDQLKLMIDSSICFGVYSPTGRLPPETSQTDVSSARNQDPADTLHEVAERVHHLAPPQAAAQPPGTPTGETSMIGFGRLVSDHVSIAYLTDVYILSQWQGEGLGTWMLDCIREYIDSLPHLRMFLLITSEGKKEKYYAKKLGTSRLVEEMPGRDFFMKKGPGSALT